jgi:antitoxin (DNA-binding transcriptional repressor) of toxin-antitoxin stability system
MLMVTKHMDVNQAPAQWQEILSQIASGVEWILTDGTTPVARLVPVSTRVAGLHAGAIWASPDFDEPLPDDFWMGSA